MKDNFNALTEARLEKLEERVHSVEVILLFMTINGLVTSIVNLLKSRKKQ